MFGFLHFLHWLLQVYWWIIVAAALISWVSPDPRNPFVMFLRQVTEPVLAPVRRLVPPWKTGGLDLSPVVVLIAIQFVDWVILGDILPRLLGSF
jgi:YggT family protein